jgi:hypothetical protein
MKRSLLLIISGDPRHSARPAEAVRIAAGILPWGQVRVKVCFRDAGVLALDPQSEDWEGGDAFARHLPAIAEHSKTIWVQTDSQFLPELSTPIVDFEKVGSAQIARAAADSDCVMHF